VLIVDKQMVVLEDLPYPYDALEPYISQKTLQIHHDKHHARYVTVANELMEGSMLLNLPVEEIIRASNSHNNPALFNNVGQAFNHDFYWKSMKPEGGGVPSGNLATLINRDFGSFKAFRKQFVASAMSVFGSGWAWLSWTPTGLKVQIL
jgi:superoxide dismutase, Fe-Mn family